MTIRPTREEIATIRAMAERAARQNGARAVRVELGERVAFADAPMAGRDPSTNILLVDTTADWEESDLFDLRPWATIRNGVPAAPGGRAVIDFYCYDRTTGELCCNTQAIFEGGRLVWAGELGPWGHTAFGPVSLQQRESAQ